ncbi:MAG: hypothetical protein ACLFQ8_01370 [Candidatus Aenigmatarchaeota archaeon]
MPEKSHFGRALEEFEKRAEIENKIFEDSEERGRENIEEIEDSIEKSEENKQEANENIKVYHRGNEEFTETGRTIEENKRKYEEGEADSDSNKVKEAAVGHLEKFKDPMDKTDDINCKSEESEEEAEGIDDYKEVLEENLENIIGAADEEIQYINELQQELETDDPCYAYDKISQFLAMEKNTVENMKNNVDGINSKRDETGDFDKIKQYSEQIEEWANDVENDIKRICKTNEFAELMLKGIGLRRKYGMEGEQYDFGHEEILEDDELGDKDYVEENEEDIKNKIVNGINAGSTSPEYVVKKFRDELPEEDRDDVKNLHDSILQSVTEDVGLEKMITALPLRSDLVYNLDEHTKKLKDGVEGDSEDEVMEEVIGAYENELREGREARDSIGEYLSRPFSKVLEEKFDERGNYSEGLEEVFNKYCTE